MGIARYFSKDLLAINKLLKGNNNVLPEILNGKVVGIAFDENAADTFEGTAALDLLIRIVARLYPRLVIIDLSGKNNDLLEQLTTLARTINCNVEILSNGAADVTVVAGVTTHELEIKGEKIFLGADKWIARYSPEHSQAFSTSKNPFGAGMSACVATSNLFRIIFKDLMNDKPLDDALTFSVLSGHLSDTFNPVIENFKIGHTTLVGAGAIGNGFLWALSKLENVSGQLDVVEPENASLSNLQRYVLFNESDVDKPKTESIKRYFSARNLSLHFTLGSWADYLSERGDWQIDTVAVAIDNKKDRVAIQTALPRKIFNSYTEENLVGIARHLDFVAGACMACGYMPLQKELNFTDQVGMQLNVNPHVIKDYLNLNMTVDAIYNNNTVSLLDMVAAANGIDRLTLTQFHGKRVNEFYSDFVCGGISLSLMPTGGNAVEHLHSVDAPLAFQSAMAGILLAAEVVIHANGIRKTDMKQQTHIHPLNRLTVHNPFHHSLTKDSTGRCVCSDTDFITVFKKKWQTASA